MVNAWVLILVMVLLGPASAYGAETVASSSKAVVAAQARENGLIYFHQGYYQDIPQGRLRESKKHLAAAEKEFLKALTLQPENLATHRYLARLYYVQKKFPAAAERYYQIFLLNPDDFDAALLAASAYAEAGSYPAAASLLEEIRERASDPLIRGEIDSYMGKLMRHGESR